jgi:hypothetical protein
MVVIVEKMVKQIWPTAKLTAEINNLKHTGPVPIARVEKSELTTIK